MNSSLYCDGGVVGKNPSIFGGTWAWCLISPGGEMIGHASGLVKPADIGLPVVTNNVTELLAAINGMEVLPVGWDGAIFTDSNCTLLRIERREDNRKPAKMNGIPQKMRDRLESARNRLGNYRVVLLGGHPNLKDLARGCRKNGGLPVSKWNVWCDRACGREARKPMPVAA